jgi:hypothetical protein
MLKEWTRSIKTRPEHPFILLTGARVSSSAVAAFIPTRNFPVGAILPLMGDWANNDSGIAVAVKKITNNKTFAQSCLVMLPQAQAVAKPRERFEPQASAGQLQENIVSNELKEAINAVAPLNLEQNRNIFL